MILDGYAVTVAAVAAQRTEPTVGEALIANHRSAEPGHELMLSEVGLEPLLDLRMRLGEASGALLAIPIIAAAGGLYGKMATFKEAGVNRAPRRFSPILACQVRMRHHQWHLTARAMSSRLAIGH